jgi:hypothetical protein
MLLLAAADSMGEPATLMRAVSQLELSGDALDPAEGQGWCEPAAVSANSGIRSSGLRSMSRLR